MKNRVLISILCVIVAVVALGAIVVGAVFRVQKTDIVRVGEDAILTTNEAGEPIELTNQQILSASGIKKGNFTLFFNKTKAIANIEAAYPYIKVLQIRILGARTIEFRVTARHEMFYYTSNNAKFFILDEDLKVLNIVTTKPDNLIQIKPILNYKDGGDDKTDNNILAANERTMAGEFLSSGEYKEIFSSLYDSMLKTVLVNPDGSLWLTKTQDSKVNELLADETVRYIERADYTKVLESVEFKTKYTLTESYLTVVLNTKAGVKIEIGKPESDLQNKINHCFSLVSMLDGQENTSSQSGTVAYEYDENGAARIRYYAENQ